MVVNSLVGWVVEVVLLKLQLLFAVVDLRLQLWVQFSFVSEQQWIEVLVPTLFEAQMVPV
jgi:hypothetical protein